jgi:hypothetical protein
MTEGGAFFSADGLISSGLRDEKVSDVWLNCQRPDWMLELLKSNCNRTHNYRSNDGLEMYIESLREMTACHYHDPSADIEHYFTYGPGISSIEEDVRSGKISILEGQRRRFIWLSIVANEATRYVFEDEVDRFDFNRFAEKIIAQYMGIEGIADFDEVDFKRNVLKKQADLLKAAIANPFQ